MERSTRCSAQLERGHGQPNSTAAVAAAKGTLSVLNRTPPTATPVAVHNLQLIPTRDPRHTMLAATQIAAIRSLILLAKDGER